MKIPLTIKTSYLPNWGMYEGVRELVQNARDAEIEEGAQMSVDYTNGHLVIENSGTTLPHSALLLGFTTKVGRSDTIGKFGEGLKLGVLALVRAGHSVRIRSGSEVWVPSIEYSHVFQADVLSFDISTGRKASDRVRIEVGGISASQWAEMKEKFLFLQKVSPENKIGTSTGSLLLGADMRGKVFVKGVFVQVLPDLQFGYDLTTADIDRDRKMIESWDLQYKTRAIYMAALSSDSSLFAQFDTMLEEQTPEVQGIDTYNASYMPPTVLAHVAEKFVTEHGTDAVPVATQAEAEEVGKLGVRGVVVNRQRGAILQRTMGDIITIKSRLSSESTQEYSFSDLSQDEKSNLADASELLSSVHGLGIARIHVMDFRSATMLGQFTNGHVHIARSILADSDETLRVLIHEVAKDDTNDIGGAHLARVEKLWVQITRNLRRVSRFDRT
jgi:hypothetical protein